MTPFLYNDRNWKYIKCRKASLCLYPVTGFTDSRIENNKTESQGYTCNSFITPSLYGQVQSQHDVIVQRKGNKNEYTPSQQNLVYVDLFSLFIPLRAVMCVLGMSPLFPLPASHVVNIRFNLFRLNAVKETPPGFSSPLMNQAVGSS